MKTFLEIATKYDIPKHKIYRCYTKHFAQHVAQQSRNKNNAVLIDSKTEKYIISMIREQEVKQEPQRVAQQIPVVAQQLCYSVARENNNNLDFYKELKERYEQENEFLKNQIQEKDIQLKEKDSQLKVKDIQLESLDKRLAESLELQKANAVLLHQSGEQSKLVENINDVEIKKSFWRKIFG